MNYNKNNQLFFLQKSQTITRKNSYFCKQCKSCEATINLLQIELQQKTPTIFTKVTNDNNNKIHMSQLIWYELNYNKNHHLFVQRSQLITTKVVTIIPKVVGTVSGVVPTAGGMVSNASIIDNTIDDATRRHRNGMGRSTERRVVGGHKHTSS
jgi:hypothetical protein